MQARRSLSRGTCVACTLSMRLLGKGRPGDCPSGQDTGVRQATAAATQNHCPPWTSSHTGVRGTGAPAAINNRKTGQNKTLGGGP